MNIILSIHPKWAKLIYEGEKTIEWRKSEPKKADGLSVIFLYETAPVCKVTGYVMFNGSYDFNADPNAYYNRRSQVYELFVKEGCVSVDRLLKYQGNAEKICAWQVYEPFHFDTARPLEEFGLKRPPQSWCYTEVDV